MNIDNAKKQVRETYDSLEPIINEVVSKHSKDLDKIFHRLTNATSLTNEEIRNAMLELSAESYVFGMDKDRALLKEECANMLMKEQMAKVYNVTDGTQQIRTNQSLIDTTDKQVVNLIYESVSNMLKTKLDEAHRMVNVLNSILISRSAEAKLTRPEVEPPQVENSVQENSNNKEIF